ncbi:hypothetical protein pEaSNUABM37_00045 [Erwinia phage pEa_SNUABM_37]|nr:hypothetical protein pEaSNUABM37_00045 [Erwinia phage pEa_SNUABM_37]QXO10515.1 hypothetical protein pEaSNUABM48_00045 [Erwinia phage pEa_SNUABM_48]
MINPAHVGTPDPKMLTLLADLLEEQFGVSERAKQASATLDRLCVELEESKQLLNKLWTEREVIMAELFALSEEMSALLTEENQLNTFSSEIIIDNIIVEIEIQFRVVTRNGNPGRAIDAIAIKQGKERVDIVSQNSTTLVVYEDKELIMDTAINSLGGSTMEDALRFVMTAVERWTLEHRHDNHFDLVIKLLIKCQVIIHPIEKVVNPTPAPVEPESETQSTRAPHTRTYIPRGKTFWREGYYRTSCNGVRHWVEGHEYTR